MQFQRNNTPIFEYADLQKFLKLCSDSNPLDKMDVICDDGSARNNEVVVVNRVLD